MNPDREQLWWPELVVDETATDSVGSLQQYFQHYFQKLLELRLWQCPFCSQSFLSAERLIVHWDDVHRLQRYHRDDFVCLAEYCELFQCGPSGDQLFNSDLVNQNEQPTTEQQANTFFETKNKQTFIKSDQPTNAFETPHTDSKCNYFRLQRLQSQCGLLAQRCSIAPLQLTSLQQLQQVQQELFDSLCSNLTCDRLWPTRLSPAS